MVLVPVVGGGVIALALKWYQKHCKSRAHREKETGWTIKSAQPAYIFNHAMNEITFNDCQAQTCARHQSNSLPAPVAGCDLASDLYHIAQGLHPVTAAHGQMVLLMLAALSSQGYPPLERAETLAEVLEQLVEGNY
ncbi:hypothetical protein ABBQ38_009873 [Trebouxia sp. C0009 RCD-2024]